MANHELDKLFFAQPHCLDRLGKEIFLKLPLYQLNRLLDPIYINNELFTSFFKKKLSWDEQAKLISQLFSVTLNMVYSTGKHCGWAYVDRQGEDPYAISLLGNQGSGRAFYTGPYFNIKGEKTPLATSKSPIHSNGMLSMEDGIWAALIGNSLANELYEKPSLVLAVLKIDPYRSLLIRIDEEGCLDRITHLFYHPQPLTAPQLEQTAINLGRHEAEKFILRILHGSWSAGNTSLAGHLMDYDSVCAVKGRQPQYGFTPSYPDNYFSFEYLGQYKNLRSLCKNSAINVDQVTPEVLEETLFTSFYQHIQKGLIYLMGFATNPPTSETLDELLARISILFCELAPYTFFNSEQNLNTNHPSSLTLHLFDFSAFFRIFPVLKFAGQFTIEKGLALLMDSKMQKRLLCEEIKQEKAKELMPRVYQAFAAFFIPIQVENSSGASYPQGELSIKNPEAPISHPPCEQPSSVSEEKEKNTPILLNELIKKANEFLHGYDHAFTIIHAMTQHDEHHITARAYLINEDRFYLFPVFPLEPYFVQQLENNSEPYTIHRLIHYLIQANRRDPKLDTTNRYKSDFRFFNEGFVYIAISTYGTYQVIFNLFPDMINWEITEQDQWEIDILNELFPSTCHINNELIQISSPELPIIELSYYFSRDYSFIMHFYHLHLNGKKVMLHDLFFPDCEFGYYL